MQYLNLRFLCRPECLFANIVMNCSHELATTKILLNNFWITLIITVQLLLTIHSSNFCFALEDEGKTEVWHNSAFYPSLPGIGYVYTSLKTPLHQHLSMAQHNRRVVGSGWEAGIYVDSIYLYFLSLPGEKKTASKVNVHKGHKKYRK